jgi:hypothetical protein
LAEALWEGVQEVVKRSGRNEPMWVAIHKCLETTLGISLYSYLYPKIAKTICLSYYLLCFLLNKIREKGKTVSTWKRWLGRLKGGEVAPTVYIYVTTCKNSKIKEQKN